MRRTQPKLIPLLIVEDNLRRVQWFDIHTPIGFRLIHAKSGGVALGMLQRDKGRVYGGILLDHDLHMRGVLASDKKVSGSEIVETIIANISRDVPILVHSMNPEKSIKMTNALEHAGFWVEKMRWYDITQEMYHEWLEEVKEEWDEYWEEQLAK